MKKIFIALSAVALMPACTRIETGEVGLRIGFDKQVQSQELVAGSFNQTLVGSVITFPVRDVSVQLDNKNPMTADNSALSDFDITVVYQINPASVSDLYTKKTKSFHAVDDSGDTYLMFNYMSTLVNTAAYKVVRQYKSLEVADNRAKIEAEIQNEVLKTLKEDKLETSLTLTLVQVRSILPAQAIINSANDLVKAQNELKIKSTEVEIAKKEAERIAALNANSKAIEYMNAQANLKIAEGVANGKVHTIVVPMDFKGIVSTAK